MWDSFCRLISSIENKTEDTTSMGNTSKKLASRCTLLTREEQKAVANTFRNASRNREKIREEDLIVSGSLVPELLEKLWGPQIDPRLAQYLSNYLFGCGAEKQSTCDFDRFAQLFVYNVRGSADERMNVLYGCLGQPYDSEIPYQLLREFCESIVSSYIRMVKTSKHPYPEKWIAKGFKGNASYIQALGEAMAASIHKDPDNPGNSCTSDQITRWSNQTPLLNSMNEYVFNMLYGMSTVETAISPDEPTPLRERSLLPRPDGIDPLPDYPAFIDIAHIVWLNHQIPHKHQHKWRFLFSTHIHGESFSTLAGRIQDVGPSLIIIQDTTGGIFGGYASESWQISPNFFGNEEAFLFTLVPKLRCYTSTGYNDHYQYMNYQTKTMPNGLMMGGQFDFGGLWINADPFGAGSCAETCSTFKGYKRLTKEPAFRIRSLEVWGVGDKPLTVKVSDERDPSILDRNPEAKAILELAGRTRHSEGLREPET